MLFTFYWLTVSSYPMNIKQKSYEDATYEFVNALIKDYKI